MNWDRVLWGDESPSLRGWVVGLVPALLILGATYLVAEPSGWRIVGAIAAAVVLRLVANRAAPPRRNRGPWT